MLTEGDPAPDFTMPDQNGSPVSLSDLRCHWTVLWWVRAVGHGREVADVTERDRAVTLLRTKYAQYADHALDGPVLAVDFSSWRCWSATPPA